MADPFIAIQIGAVSFVDEGVNGTLDTLQERGAVNALFLATPTWTRGTGGRQVPGHPLPDHGTQEYDHDWVGGNYAEVHPQFYGNTVLGSVGRAPEHPDWDFLEAVVPEAKSRGMHSYAWMEESGYAQALRNYPNFPKVLEVDVWGRPTTRPCFNNPDYRNWHLGIVEDYVKNYDLDGLAWCSERPGPLNLAIQGPITPGLLSCFCPHCKAIAAERGIDSRRAVEGYRKLLEWNQAVSSDQKPADGAFVTFWRLLLQYPEILAWQTLWTDSQRQIYRDIYGVAKACKSTIEVGWHVYHDISFSPFYRADQDYAELSKLSDFIKVVSYNNCAGPRFHTWMGKICNSLFADATPEETYPLMLKLLQLDEGSYADLPQTGFTAEYVRRETVRALSSVGPDTKIYPGIDIDIPVGRVDAAVNDRRKRSEAASGINADTTDGADLTHCTPEGVKAAVLAAFEGGAQGVVLSRKYSEMKLENLGGAGDAVRELRR
ncbi:MAG TPA: hypothetical protein VHC49_00075 [Mycobacteriales bacterium]|nr:hypothetical protein [Mycobacteriales bacterium]